MKKINFSSKFSKFSDRWSPKVIAEMNDYQFKLVKIKDDFIWHKHDDTDEVFIVMEGQIFIEFENETVEINSPIESKQRIGITLGLLIFVVQDLENFALTYAQRLHFFLDGIEFHKYSLFLTKQRSHHQNCR